MAERTYCVESSEAADTEAVEADSTVPVAPSTCVDALVGSPAASAQPKTSRSSSAGKDFAAVSPVPAPDSGLPPASGASLSFPTLSPFAVLEVSGASCAVPKTAILSPLAAAAAGLSLDST